MSQKLTGNEPAQPQTVKAWSENMREHVMIHFPGETLRMKLAAQMLAAEICREPMLDPRDKVSTAIWWADELITQLNNRSK